MLKMKSKYLLSSEVCTMVKSHWGRWRDRNNIGYGPASARNSIAMQVRRGREFKRSVNTTISAGYVQC